MSKIYIYLAGPITGKTEQEATEWRDMMTRALNEANPNFVAVSPIRAEAPDINGIYSADYSWTMAHEITAKNWLDVQRCDCVLAYLPARSIGTLLELGWAAGLNKTVILLSPLKEVLEHPIVMQKVPFRFNSTAGQGGWNKALNTIVDLFGVYA